LAERDYVVVHSSDVVGKEGGGYGATGRDGGGGATAGIPFLREVALAIAECD
jgi:hypothetical protein